MMATNTGDLPVALADAAQHADENQSGLDRSVADWYKDAVIYQLHVKAFQDSNGDGVGDFAGLMQRLDYVQSLGVNTIWLLPFYPSPLRDDGYDISDYLQVNESYGDLDQFKAFIAEAHRRGIRVITELVINHTSDQHPWFQAARAAPPGSPEREFYVWSDTDEKYAGTRIIFLDTEKSNWTWDAQAGAYYWHRFYSHQPDLNFANPAVFEEVVKSLRYWLNLGVDGLRLDAVPYLCEREGTNNENLPETHLILKRIRAELDALFPDRMLLAEANQWPEDTRPYFGDGDECHMAFHFPLMPRMYMALAQEDRHPVTDILRQTPEIPENCQWTLFLRNHDELTLEMVTEDERDYLWRTYASDPRARINLGIRRRLAPLLDNDRRKIELMNALLLSMPGTPVIYYGDELGMGDNYYLGDRDGVRTPMQWSADRNAGFSRADPQRLYLPPIMDANFGYQAINVEAQQRDRSSLLNWMQRMISVRKQHVAFGRGSLTFLYPRNRKVLAYLRQYDEDTLLCVFNLARTAQAVELDLSSFRGATPVELGGNSPFPSIGDLPYMLTMPAYGFYWFLLAKDSEEPHWRVTPVEAVADPVTAVFAGGWAGLLEGRERLNLERWSLPEFVVRQRWFGAKHQKIASLYLHNMAVLDNGADGYPMAILRVGLEDGEELTYFLPLTALWGAEHVAAGSARLPFTLAKLRRGARIGALLDATRDDSFAVALVHATHGASNIETVDGQIAFERAGDWEKPSDDCPVRPVGAEQSNNSIIVDERILVKIYRRLRAGVQPEIEITRFLTEVAGYRNTPAFLGQVEHRPRDGEPTTLAGLFAFVHNQGDCWRGIVDALERHLDDVLLKASADAEEQGEESAYYFPLDLADVLGRRTAELHAALASGVSDPAFAMEPVTQADISAWVATARREAESAFATLERLDAATVGHHAVLAEQLLAARDEVRQRLQRLEAIPVSGQKTRVHGDYHLGQLLMAQGDVVIIDFEGEPARSLEDRREKTSPMRDVAGMVRSLDYATFAALDRVATRNPDLPQAVADAAALWRASAQHDFLAAYADTARHSPAYPMDETAARGQMEIFLLQKVFYEITYEAANRPGWIDIPLRGALEILSGGPRPRADGAAGGDG